MFNKKICLTVQSKCCRFDARQKIDLVLELIDARAPKVTRVTEVGIKMPQNAVKWTVLTKTDLADPTVTAEWLNWFKQRLEPVFVMKNQLINRQLWMKQLRRLKQKRHQNVIRALVIGIANVGKSTLINRLLGNKKAITGNQPGLTKNYCWFRVNDWFKVTDTCGHTPRLVVGQSLSTTTSTLVWVKALLYHYVDLDQVCWSGLWFLWTHYRHQFYLYFKLNDSDGVGDWTEADLLFWAEQHQLVNSQHNQLQIRFLNDLSRGRVGLISFERVNN